MKTDEIRNKYLKFFESRGARIVPSDSLVPGNDPTLLFTGAGMNQFKDQFMGLRIEFSRATSCQKCIRTGDIMNVGVTPSHHTMFEMMGNFSFGDYFKKEAITWAWEFLTKELGISEALLQVTVHNNDDEAYGIWQNEVGLPESKITRLGDHDNFWPADAPKLGPNGPCGPCSEIFYDRGEQYGCGKPDCDITCECRRYVEIWNLVFTQFDRQPDGSLEPLPQCNIDTGMGLERMASCMQGTVTNMDIDIFQPITAAIAAAAGKKYGDDKADDVLIRRIADHARAVTFCIADGVMPANSHRGYVLKRLLRRAMSDGRSLGIEKAFLNELVAVVADAMKAAYPEVLERAASIAATVKTEEDKFLTTLGKGLNLIESAVERIKAEGGSVFDGKTAFELYDTYGFPYELAEEIVEKEGMSIDREGFDEAMTEAKMKAREGAKMKGDVFAKGPITEVKKLTHATEFLGYETTETAAKVIAIISGENLVDEATADTDVTVVLDKSSFYGESGGQVGDTGIIVGEGNLVIEVDDTRKMDDIHFHVGRVESGTVKTGMTVNCEVDAARRGDIRRNHTVTHLLQNALKNVLGNEVEQRGSYVAPDRMRFDFQHSRGLTPDEIRKVEEAVNGRILENSKVVTEVLPIEKAKELGAIALFGEKYGDTVRVVKIDDYSVEFCGGTHMDQTGPIGQFRIIAEESVSAGVRRIEGLTGASAYRLSRNQAETLSELSRELKVPANETLDRIRAVMEEAKLLRKELASIRQDQMKEHLDNIQPEEVAGVKLVKLNLGPVLGKDLAAAADIVRRKVGEDGVCVLAGADEEKVGLVVTVGKELAPKRLKAGDVIKKLAAIVGGGGGGRPEMAQAGGKKPENLMEMLNSVPATIEELMSVSD